MGWECNESWRVWHNPREKVAILEAVVRAGMSIPDAKQRDAGCRIKRRKAV